VWIRVGLGCKQEDVWDVCGCMCGERGVAAQRPAACSQACLMTLSVEAAQPWTLLGVVGQRHTLMWHAC